MAYLKYLYEKITNQIDVILWLVHVIGYIIM